MIRSHSFPECRDDLVQIELPQVGALDLRYHGEPFATIGIDGESGSASRADGGMRAFDGEFDVLRVVIEPAQDDQVLQPTRHENLVLLHESEVAGSHPGSGSVGE